MNERLSSALLSRTGGELPLDVALAPNRWRAATRSAGSAGAHAGLAWLLVSAGSDAVAAAVKAPRRSDGTKW